MRLLAGKRRRKEHDKERQGWRFFGVGFALPSGPPRDSSCPSLAAAGRCQQLQLSKTISRLFFSLDDNK